MIAVEVAPAALSPSFREIFESEFAYVSRALRRLGVREADLKDVAQELFLTVHHHLGEYDPARPRRPWPASGCPRCWWRDETDWES